MCELAQPLPRETETQSCLCRDQEGRWGSDEVVPGTSVFPSSETGMSQNFWGRFKGAKYRFALQDGTWDLSSDAVVDTDEDMGHQGLA